MAEHQYYSEEVLIEKMERGEYGCFFKQKTAYAIQV